jgi:hydroxyacylglutathione hydrolase
VLLQDGDEFMVGNIRVQVRHTPGHTPEHVSFVVTDTAGADQPMGVFTGDFVFVGDVGRPDLLEKAAGVAGTMEAGARQLFGHCSACAICPTGSSCGRATARAPRAASRSARCRRRRSATRSSSTGRSRSTTRPSSSRRCSPGQPEPPKYFAEMKRINREGPRVLHGFPRPPRMKADRLSGLVAERAVVVDTRSWAAYRAGFVPGTINIPLNRSFTTWAGWLLPYDRDVHLIVADGAESALREAVRDLAMIGLDRVAGYFGEDAVQAHGSLRTLAEVTPEQVRRMQETRDVALLDVRGRSEWEAGHIPGVPNIPLGYLTDRLAEVPAGRPLVVHCETGSRSAIAASLLAARGETEVLNMTGGYSEWAAGEVARAAAGAVNA